MYKCIIIDDEELGRELLKNHVEKVDFLELVGSFENPLDAMTILKKEDIKIVFLDIQMPEIKGTEFAKLVPSTAKIIFTTAYSEYALEGFELDAADYLLKPIAFQRFLKAVQKIKTDTPIYPDTLTIKSGYDFFKVKIDEITHIESDSEYVVFYANRKKIMSYQTLKSLERTLDPSQFIRVHRSFIVNKSKVTGLKGRDLILSDVIIPVSDSYYEVVKKELFS
ncbi:LytR/AlgR family response regulator transcription factor [Flavobacterium muglaense]|uniref:Response regulator transcription factor n=1 Tax=Flavobacterium muglaense TaxID=2764716 RepID=A0A923SGM3_9FLAO|nr:LytTR family DNA-binding domain-containing protein [Flavobacterium muglaense]MBC5838364.1 response regulator transcription factor [Flavobacterium muglaense]MBC5844859.1 response regulator transcription factor [Flavobacterium muglaense]